LPKGKISVSKRIPTSLRVIARNYNTYFHSNPSALNNLYGVNWTNLFASAQAIAFSFIAYLALPGLSIYIQNLFRTELNASATPNTQSFINNHNLIHKTLFNGIRAEHRRCLRLFPQDRLL
jgi:hypothetical protein